MDINSNISNLNTTHSLNDGTHFNKNKNNSTSLSKKKINIEGFTTTELTAQSNDVLNKTIIKSQEEQTLKDLKNEYNKTLEEYNKLFNEIQAETNKYISRVNSNNPYLNKNIRFNTGEIAYVTTMGIVKLYDDNDIIDSTAGVNGCPLSTNAIDVSIPWLAAYNKPNVEIPTRFPLITGTPMKKGQTCGNEGKNIRVTSFVNSKNTNKLGCYIDDYSNPTLTYIGDKPPKQPQDVMNPTFNVPELKNNTHKYIKNNYEVVGWDFDAVIINNSSAWGYPMPYPSGNQAVSLQNKGSMSQRLFLVKGDYALSFKTVGRRTQNGPNTVKIYLGDKEIYSILPSTDRWRGYDVKISIDKDGDYTIKFAGQNASGDKSSAIQDVRMKYNKNNSGAFTLQACKESAVNMFYKYFGLQDYNSTTGKGYCAVSNNEPVYNCNTETSNIYSLNEVGIKSNMGNVAYVDENAELFPYTDVKLTNTYAQIRQLNSEGNNIKTIENSTLENCQNECNKNNECYGFAFNNKKNICDLKNTSFYPNADTKVDFERDLFIRNKAPSQVPTGVSDTVVDTNTIYYENYVKGSGSLQSSYGIKNVNTVKMQELDQLRTRLDILSKDIVAYAERFGSNSNKLLLQSKANIKGLNDFAQDIKKANENISNFDLNHENILNESEILVLQENYNYMFWSILAIGSVLVAMNV